MSYYTYPNGNKSFLVDSLDKKDVETALSKHGIHIEKIIDAMFGIEGKVLMVDFVVSASDAEISFALDSITKLVRPYPKGFTHQG